jgi:hypothetical protein
VVHGFHHIPGQLDDGGVDIANGLGFPAQDRIAERSYRTDGHFFLASILGETGG